MRLAKLYAKQQFDIVAVACFKFVKLQHAFFKLKGGKGFKKMVALDVVGKAQNAYSTLQCGVYVFLHGGASVKAKIAVNV
jgi:hypothetical protein